MSTSLITNVFVKKVLMHVRPFGLILMQVAGLKAEQQFILRLCFLYQLVVTCVCEDGMRAALDTAKKLLSQKMKEPGLSAVGLPATEGLPTEGYSFYAFIGAMKRAYPRLCSNCEHVRMNMPNLDLVFYEEVDVNKLQDLLADITLEEETMSLALEEQLVKAVDAVAGAEGGV